MIDDTQQIVKLTLATSELKAAKVRYLCRILNNLHESRYSKLKKSIKVKQFSFEAQLLGSQVQQAGVTLLQFGCRYHEMMNYAFQMMLKHTLFMSIQIKTNYQILLNLMCMQKNNRYNLHFIKHARQNNRSVIMKASFHKMVQCTSVPATIQSLTQLKFIKLRHAISTLTTKMTVLLLDAFYMLKSKNTSKVTKISKIKSILQKQATKRFLHRAQKMKSWNIKQAFATYYNNVHKMRLRQLKLLINISSIVHSTLIKCKKSMRILRIGHGTDRKIPKSTVKSAATRQITQILCRSIHRCLSQCLSLIQKSHAIPKKVNRQVAKYQFFKTKLRSIIKAPKSVLRYWLRYSFQAISKVKLQFDDSTLMIDCFQHYCYLMTKISNNSRNEMKQLGQRARNNVLKLMLMNRLVQQKTNLSRGFRAFKAILPQYNYRLKTQLIARLQQLEKQKERLMNQY